MVKKLPALLFAISVTLTGCSDDSIRTYCGKLETALPKISEMATAKTSGELFSYLPALQDLAKAAPSDLKNEWQVFNNAILGLRDAARAAKLPDSYLLASKKLPNSVSEKDRVNIVAAANQLRSLQVKRAGNGISQQAIDVCKVSIGL